MVILFATDRVPLTRKKKSKDRANYTPRASPDETIIRSFFLFNIKALGRQHSIEAPPALSAGPCWGHESQNFGWSRLSFDGQ